MDTKRALISAKEKVDELNLDVCPTTWPKIVRSRQLSGSLSEVRMKKAMAVISSSNSIRRHKDWHDFAIYQCPCWLTRWYSCQRLKRPPRAQSMLKIIRFQWSCFCRLLWRDELQVRLMMPIGGFTMWHLIIGLKSCHGHMVNTDWALTCFLYSKIASF